MTNLLKPAPVKQQTAWLMIGPDLRAAGSNAQWRRLHLPGGETHTHERIDKLFPASEIAASVLDVLASGVPSENVVVRMGGDGEERFLCASFHPCPSATKPKRVQMQVWEMKARLLLDGETGEILEANEAASKVFGETSLVRGKSPWFAGPLRSSEARAAALAAATRNGSHYLGRFKHRRQDGCEVELESLLVVVEEGSKAK